MSIEQVKEFADWFGLPTETSVKFPREEIMEFRILRQLEEFREFQEAYLERDTVAAFDALLDAAYILYGTALAMGISPHQWNKGFAAVHKANMTKCRAQRAEESKYGMTFDIVKPAGWVGPEKELVAILRKWPK